MHFPQLTDSRGRGSFLAEPNRHSKFRRWKRNSHHLALTGQKTRERRVAERERTLHVHGGSCGSLPQTTDQHRRVSKLLIARPGKDPRKDDREQRPALKQDRD